MGKLTVATIVSLDGVAEKPIWSNDYWNEETINIRNTDLQECDILLLGNKTYESYSMAFKGYSNDDYSRRINTVKKVVVSDEKINDDWVNEVIKRGNIERIREIKKDNNILVIGSLALVDFLLEHDMVDEIHHLLIPVFVGRGKKLFQNNISSLRYYLSSSKAYNNGAIYSIFTK